MNKTYCGEFVIVLFIVALTLMTMYSTMEIERNKPKAPIHKRVSLEHVHEDKHEAKETKVLGPEQPKANVQIVLPPNVSLASEPSRRLFVLTTGERKFKKPPGFSVDFVYGTGQANIFATTYDDGFGPKEWPEGAKRVAEGHVTVWKRIVSECSDWCFVSEDDAEWPSVPLPKLPSDGLVSYFKQAVCDAATTSYSRDYKRVTRRVVRGRCMPYGAVAYALSRSFAKTLLDALPMDKPVDHFLWEQAVKHQKGFVARNFRVRHKRGKSLRESVVRRRDQFKSKEDNDIRTKRTIVIKETRHDEHSLSKSHRLVKYSRGPELRGEALKSVLHTLMEHVDTVMARCSVQYAIFRGTLLGARRHHGFIPWDVDIDVLIEAAQLAKLTSCLETYEEHDSIHWIVRHGKDSDIIAVKVVDRNSGYYVDIWMCWKKNNRCKDRLSSKHYNFDDLFPTKPCYFDHLVVQCPRHPTPILIDLYRNLRANRLHHGPTFLSVKWVEEPEKKVARVREKIAVAIPTYDRLGYVKLCAEALINTVNSSDVYIFDDRSTSYSTNELKQWFQTDNVRINHKRFKPDRQARSIVEWFVDTDYDWLVTLDSDLIVRPDWLQILRKHMAQTDGVVSLYHSANTGNHPTLRCDEWLCEMKSLGNAGIVWSKPLAKIMLDNVKGSHAFDWGWSKWLAKNEIKQYAFKNSLVLHVGMHGTWGDDSKREKALGFDMTTLSKGTKEIAQMFLEGIRSTFVKKNLI